MFLPYTLIGYLLDWKKFQSLGKINLWVPPDSLFTVANLITDEIRPCAIHGKTNQGEKQSLDVWLSKLKWRYKLEDADGGRKMMVMVEVLMMTSSLDEVVWEWYGGGAATGSVDMVVVMIMVTMVMMMTVMMNMTIILII